MDRPPSSSDGQLQVIRSDPEAKNAPCEISRTRGAFMDLHHDRSRIITTENLAGCSYEASSRSPHPECFRSPRERSEGLLATASTVPMSLLSQVAPVTFSCPVPHRNSCPCRRVGADLPCERDEEAPGLGGVVPAPSSRRSQQCEEITRGDCYGRSAQAAASAGIRRLISRSSASLGALLLDRSLIRSFARARSRGEIRAYLLARGHSRGRAPRERSAYARSRIDGCARTFSLWKAFEGPVPRTPESIVCVEHVPGRIRGLYPRIG